MLRQLFKTSISASLPAHAMAEPIDLSTGTSEQQPSNVVANKLVTNNSVATGFNIRHSATNVVASRILNKSNPVAKLAREMARPGYHPAPITLGSNADPYAPCEQGLETTRQLLELMLAHSHPVHIVTKSHLIVKDLDLLAKLAMQRLCTVEICVNTLNSELGGKIEPRTSSPAARMKAIARLSDAGVPVGAMMAPVIPVVNDGELESLLHAVKEAGAITAGYEYLALPNDVKQSFNHWLQRHFPDQAERISTLSQAHIHNTGNNACEFATMVHQRFQQACLSLGLNRTGLPALDTTRFSALPKNAK